MGRDLGKVQIGDLRRKNQDQSDFKLITPKWNITEVFYVDVGANSLRALYPKG